MNDAAIIVQEISYQNPLNIVKRLSDLNQLVFLDSSKVDTKMGSHSYIALDPFATLIYQNGCVIDNDTVETNKSIFNVLREKLHLYQFEPDATLPPFQGGMAGYFSYDLGRDIEKLPTNAIDDQQIPRLIVGLYDLVISFDHIQKKAWIISSGYPETKSTQRQERAKQRLAWCQAQLNNPEQYPLRVEPPVNQNAITSNFTRESYIDMVDKTIQYILNGDIFEANMSQRFQTTLPDNTTPFDLYQRLRHFNPAPFSAYVQFNDLAIASSSPERFLQSQKGIVETWPIKGTIHRSQEPQEDALLAKKLQQSKKDRAENTMIVDLMRNDLSRVCMPHSVKVPQYCAVETFETVHHLVSMVQGQLNPVFDNIHLLEATFPGGSITGAPKLRVMEIIDELEPTQRGPYCGSIGYIGFNGNMDTSIVIRSFVCKGQTVTFQAGGAIVLDSKPEAEYEETLIKAKALIKALTETIIVQPTDKKSKKAVKVQL